VQISRGTLILIVLPKLLLARKVSV
jgi:hypothetical protein